MKEMSQPTEYEILGVTPGASFDEVRTAYTSLIKKWHPDVTQSPAADARVKDLNRAYSELRRQLVVEQWITRPAPRPVTIILSKKCTGQSRAASHRIRDALTWVSALCATVAASTVIYHSLQTPPATETRVRAGASISRAHRLLGERFETDAVATHAVEELLDRLRDDQGGYTAVLYSRQCYSEVTLYPDPRLLDHCTAFDVAAQAWIRTSEQGARIAHAAAYFASANSRHRRDQDSVAFDALRGGLRVDPNELELAVTRRIADRASFRRARH